MDQIKVLIVDDSALVRQTFKEILGSAPEIKVIGTASDPYIAVQKIQKEMPDVMTLDVVMPKMDGITFLGKIMQQAPMPVVVISNQTKTGADVALKALEVGAVEVMTKPDLSSEDLLQESKILLIDTIRSAYFAGKKRKGRIVSVEESHTRSSHNHQISWPSRTIIAIGASTGGTEALKSFLMGLPSEMPPILVVQHMPEKFTNSFAKRLDETCKLTVREAKHGEKVLPNTVYIAPGNFHMSIFGKEGNKMIKIAEGDLVNRHRPSVNVLFNSVAKDIGKYAIGIIMTGMGDDGATGLLNMHKSGAYTIAQDEKTSVVFGMPYKAIMAGGVTDVLPLPQISNQVCSYLNKVEKV